MAVFEHQLEIQRIEKAQELRKLGVNPYPHFLKKDMSIADFRTKFSFYFYGVRQAFKPSAK